MSNIKFTELVADTSPTSDDLIVTVNDPAGVPANRKVTLSNAITKAHGLADSTVIGVASGVLTSGVDVAVVDGGTGASTAVGARTNLGLVIGADVQAYDADLTAIVTAFVPASAVGPSSFDFYENTVNGTNKITLIVPASISLDKILTLPEATDTLVGKATVDTLTNKTIDANGTGNVISNIEVADLAGTAVVTAAEGLASSNNDTSLPTTAAVIAGLDAKQPLDTDLTTIAGLTATTDNFIQSKASAWSSRTPTQVTADLIVMTGDAGAGGVKGLVPAPAAGDAAASKFLKADGTWTIVPGGGGTGDVVGPASSVDNTIVRFDGTTGKLIQGYISGAPTISDIGAVIINNTLEVVNATSSAFACGLNGATNPSLRVDNSTASQITGISIIGGSAAGPNTQIQSISSGLDAGISIIGKGTGNVGLYCAGLGDISFVTNSSTRVQINSFSVDMYPLLSAKAGIDSGSTGLTTGTVNLYGQTSGKTTITVPAVAGTVTFTLPVNAGSASQFLQTNGSGVLSWATASGSGDVSKVGVPVDNQVGVWTGNGTIEGDVAFTFDTLTDVLYVGGTIELGHATDTTLSRVSAGQLAVEGINILMNGGALGTPASGTLTNCSGLPLSGVVDSISEALGVGTIELGHATDTTIARVSAGVVSIEGINILTVAGGTLTGALTLGENTSIALDPAGSADGKYTGTTISGVAGYAQSFGDLVYLSAVDSRWELCDANAASAAAGDSRGIIGIVVSAGAADGSACIILLNGIIRADLKFPTMTINAPMYVSETAGAITGTVPVTTDAVMRPVGFAITADELRFDPSSDYATHT